MIATTHVARNRGVCWNVPSHGLRFGDASHTVPQVTAILAGVVFSAVGMQGIHKMIELATE